MGKWNIGPKNGMWKGGRITEPRGYVLVRVGKDHPLADCRGYAYEHRLNAAASKGDVVHHDNETKGDNSPGNLIKTTRRLHRVYHRKAGSNLRKPDEPNEIIPCACGCGTTFPKYDNNGLGRPRRYVSGHNPQPAATQDAIIAVLNSGPKTRAELIQSVNLSAQCIAIALSKMKRQGKIINRHRGVWSLIK